MNQLKRQRVVVLISGSGSNLQALIEASQHSNSGYDIVGVISNRPQAFGLVRAQQQGIPIEVIDHREFADRADFDAHLQARIDELVPDWIVLAGFMRILTAQFTDHFAGRMLNIHPSLLPKHPGLNTHQRALDAGDNEHGVSVHFVTSELDGGPIIIQAVVPIESDDNAEQLAARVLEFEHCILPLALSWLVAGRLTMSNGRAVLDNQTLPAQGVRYDPAAHF